MSKLYLLKDDSHYCLIVRMSNYLKDELLPWMCPHDEAIVNEFLKEKGVKMSVWERNCYAHPLLVALDFAVFKQKKASLDELRKLIRKLIRPIPFWGDWSLNVYHHDLIYNRKQYRQIGGYVWNYATEDRHR